MADEALEALSEETDASSESEGEGQWLGSDSERSADDAAYESDFVVSDHDSDSASSDDYVDLCSDSDSGTEACAPRKHRRVVMSDESDCD